MTRWSKVKAGGVAMALLAFTPWAHVSVSILGVSSPDLDFKGTQIGTDVGEIPWGWLLIGAAAVIVFTQRARATRVAAGLCVAFTLINLTTLAGGTVHAVGTANGQQVDDLLSPTVAPAWGSYAELLVAIVVAIAVFRRRYEAPGDSQPLPPLLD
jgi:hypothetical protein